MKIITKKQLMDFFSDFGRSLLLPIAILALTGLLLGISAALLRADIQDLLPFLKNPIIFYILTTIRSISGKAFELIPILFAISVAFGLAKKEKEIAALAGFIGYYMMLFSASLMIKTGLADTNERMLTSVLGINDTLQMGAVAGMIAGVLTAFLHNKYYKIQFPIAIAFFGGKRFVAIVVIIWSAILGQLLPFIWGPISMAIEAIGTIISHAGYIGVFLFGFLERILIPTGLHHIINQLFRTTVVGGSFGGIDGTLNIFMAYFGKVDISQLKPFTQFLGQGKMPFMMFGLPAAAYAIYKTTPSNKKTKVKALMIAGAAAAFVTGITEPIEFAFLFIAPLLFVFHAVMAGLSFVLMSLLGVGIGNTGGGLIDFILYGVLVKDSKWYMVVIVGLIYAPSYYFVFKWYLTKKHISIDTSDEELTPQNTGKANNIDNIEESIESLIISGLGGRNNIDVVNNCLTRLRVDIIDKTKVDRALLKATGALGFVDSSDTHIQVIYGPKVEKLASLVRDIL
ncbi:PTS transporter subunit EIIC [Orbus wheelerorum]